ncbi:hypothetical protein DRN98_04860 [Methanosarcinales archaeon]|nr:MAG: hypothetical protein DRN98_04860 [Methanosarcinales archaeon]
MNHHLLLISIILLSAVAPVSADDAVCIVDDYELNPSVFMTGDTGTITFTIKNTAPSSSGLVAEIERVNFYGNGIDILSKGFMQVGEIGPQDTIDFTFKLKANRPEGTYYPKLLVEFANGKTIRYTIPVEVDNTAPEVVVSSIPDDLRIGEESEIKLEIANRRANAVYGVRIDLITEGLAPVPSSRIISMIEPNEVKEVSFNITPSTSIETLSFEFSYKNGENYHQGNLITPVLVREGVVQRLMLTGFEFNQKGKGYTLTGEINNAGEEDLEGVIISLNEKKGIKPIQPYMSYFIGSIEKDDFASFELTLEIEGDGNLTTITLPLLIEYRDLDGNSYSMMENVTFNLNSHQGRDRAEIPDWLPALIIAVAIIAVGFAISYSWKKRR